MQKGNSRLAKRALVGVLTGVTIAILVALFFKQFEPDTPLRQEPTAAARTATPVAARRDPSPPGVVDFETTASDSTRGFTLVVDRAVIRHPEGRDEIVPLNPHATRTTLSSRLRELSPEGRAFPLCRETTAPADTPPRIVTAEVLLKLAALDTASPELPMGVFTIGRPDYARDYLLVTAADPFAALAALPELRRLPGVVGADVQLASWQVPRTMPTDPLVAQQWHLKYQNQANAIAGTDINVENAWLFGTPNGVKGAGIRVGVVDDGLETAHPDLAVNVDTANDKDWNGNDFDPNPGNSNNHGTACAGNVAAVANNSLGGCGSAPEATLVGLRLIAAATTDSQEAEAMNYLSTGANLIHVKTNSWGPSDTGSIVGGPGPLTTAALENATSQGRGGLGTVFLWAGGNGNANGDNSNYDGYANNPHVIGIGAMDSQGHQSYYSEPGANLACVSPSNGTTGTLGITTTDRTGNSGYNKGDYTTTFGGTSSATPTTAGVVALVLQKNPSLGWRDVKEILMRSAKKIAPADSDWTTNGGGFHFNHKFGAGLVDATAAVNLAAHWINLPAATTIDSTLSGLPTSIPDNNPTGISRTFVIGSAPSRVESVTVTLDITHTYRGDLAITLTSPSGTVSRLSEFHADATNNYPNWTFSTVHHWGESSTGTWMLKVADLAAQDTGTLNSATLKIFGTPTTFADWIAQYVPLSEMDPSDDPDHDGLPNLAEYHLGGRPDLADSGVYSPKLNVSSNELTLDWWHPKSSASSLATVEVSSTLEENSWSPANAIDEILTDTGNAEHHQVVVPIQAQGSPEFLRLRVNEP